MIIKKQTKKQGLYQMSILSLLFLGLGVGAGSLSSPAQAEDLMEGQANIEELRQDIKDLTSTIERMQKRIEYLEKNQVTSSLPIHPSSFENKQTQQNKHNFSHTETDPSLQQKDDLISEKSNDQSSSSPSAEDSSSAENEAEKEVKRLESDLKKAKLRWVKGPTPQLKEDQKIVVQPFKKTESLNKTEKNDKLSEKYEKARQAMAEGDAVKAKKLFQPLIEKPSHSFYAESLYWMGVISLVDDQRPKEAASYLSRSYQECLKTKEEKSLIFKQSVLLKLVESLIESGQKKNAALILRKFFQLDDEKSKLSSSDLGAYKKLHRKALAFKKQLT
jgi:archaellum component FlaC